MKGGSPGLPEISTTEAGLPDLQGACFPSPWPTGRFLIRLSTGPLRGEARA